MGKRTDTILEVVTSAKERIAKMTDIEEVISNLEIVYQWVTVDIKFAGGFPESDYEIMAGRISNAIALLKEQDDEIYALGVELASANELAEGYAELLKEQEAVKPEMEHSGSGVTWWNVCGHCKTAINPNDKFCHECGRPVLWIAGMMC